MKTIIAVGECRFEEIIAYFQGNICRRFLSSGSNMNKPSHRWRMVAGIRKHATVSRSSLDNVTSTP